MAYTPDCEPPADARERRRRRARAARIRRFTERQRQTREWINFAEIAEWCSKEIQSIVPSEEKRAAAFDCLASDLLAGEFEENGRSQVRYLHPITSKEWMTRKSLQDAIENNYDNHHGRSQYLPYCWIPRRLFERWLANHRLEQSPARFQARGPERASKKGQRKIGAIAGAGASGASSRRAGWPRNRSRSRSWPRNSASRASACARSR